MHVEATNHVMRADRWNSVFQQVAMNSIRLCIYTHIYTHILCMYIYIYTHIHVSIHVRSIIRHLSQPWMSHSSLRASNGRRRPGERGGHSSVLQQPFRSHGSHGMGLCGAEIHEETIKQSKTGNASTSVFLFVYLYISCKLLFEK